MRLAPAIMRGSHLFEFPRPVLSCRLQDSWDFLKLKVPLKPGNELFGNSQDGVLVAIDGQFGSSQGTVKLSEAAMLDAVVALRSALNVSEENRFDLILFQGSDGATRSFKNCLSSRLEIDFSNPALFSYSALVQVGDPQLYS